jgi:ELWxxDGT repeat protein
MELWRADGTPGGTRLVKDINPGRWSSSPHTLTDVNGTLFFAAQEQGGNLTQLWKTDGTAAGTVPLPLAEVAPHGAVAFKNRLYFPGTGKSAQSALWASDGTVAGTTVIRSFEYVADLAVVGGTLYFTASDGVHGAELWKSDGTPGGTVMVKDISPDRTGSHPAHLTAVGNRLFFAANDGTHGTELWTSDGTAAGTRMVEEINPGLAPSLRSYGTELLDGGAVLYFTADDGVHGPELWRSDGTAAGTWMVKDINSRPSPLGSNP